MAENKSIPLVKKRIPFSLSDAAGILFFANAFKFAHDFYEEICLNDKYLKTIFLSRENFVPIVHAESDYFHPLKPSETVLCRLDIIHLGNSSFRSQVSIFKDNMLCCVVRLTHVFVDSKNKKSCPIPSSIKKSLNKLLSKKGPQNHRASLKIEKLRSGKRPKSKVSQGSSRGS